MEPKLGDIWREVDPRFNRHVIVMADHGGKPGTVQVQTAYRVPESIGWTATGRRVWAKTSRFNGKRGGYSLVIRASQSDRGTAE